MSVKRQAHKKTAHFHEKMTAPSAEFRQKELQKGSRGEIAGKT